MQFNLFSPPTIERPSALAVGIVFRYGGRSLRVHRVYGVDPHAPVILEELASGASLKGQYALWSVGGVTRAINGASSWHR